MNYFLDTEFIERMHQSLFGKARHVIDLISIGIVAEDGREYYAVSSEYNYSDASDWVKANVIQPLYIDTVHGDMRNMFTVRDFNKTLGKSNMRIMQEVRSFCLNGQSEDPSFIGYYCDYDWVLFCSLFGTMMELPGRFPKYCIDLKQTLDEKASWYSDMSIPKLSVKQCLEVMKMRNDYPKQENEHSALADARWNKALYEFLRSF